MKAEKVTTPLVGVLNVVIFLAFFFAKIFDKIDWSWWWVFSPLWIPIAVLFAVVTVCGLLWITTIIIDLWK